MTFVRLRNFTRLKIASLTLEEWTGDAWVPFETNLQIELVMLDPYIRTALDYNGDVRTDQPLCVAVARPYFDRLFDIDYAYF